MRIIPLTGQVLVELDPPAKFADLGKILMLPQRTPSPEENQQAARRPEMPLGVTGIVREIGAWPKLRNGMALMPEFGRGAKVVIGANAGQQMLRGIGEKFRMVHIGEVLAVVTP